MFHRLVHRECCPKSYQIAYENVQGVFPTLHTTQEVIIEIQYCFRLQPHNDDGQQLQIHKGLSDKNASHNRSTPRYPQSLRDPCIWRLTQDDSVLLPMDPLIQPLLLL